MDSQGAASVRPDSMLFGWGKGGVVENRIGGVYYATMDVPDKKKKRLWTKSVYVGKEEVARLMNMAEAPHHMSKTPDGFDVPSLSPIISNPEHNRKWFDIDACSEDGRLLLQSLGEACSRASWLSHGGTCRSTSPNRRNFPGPTAASRVKDGAFQNLCAACEALNVDKHVGQNEKRRSRSGYCSVMEVVG